MVMTFRGHKHIVDPQHCHEVEIEQTEANEFEVISTARWASLDLAGNLIGTAVMGSKKPLFEDHDYSDDDYSDDGSVVRELGRSQSLPGVLGRTQSLPARAYEFGKAGWSALERIDSFLSSMENGMSFDPITSTVTPKPSEEEGTTVDEISSVSSSTDDKVNEQELDETLSISTGTPSLDQSKEGNQSKDDDEEKADLAPKSNARDHQERGDTTKSGAQDSKVDKQVRATYKRRMCKMASLLVAFAIVIAVVFAVKSNTTPVESNGNRTVAFQPPSDKDTIASEPDVLSVEGDGDSTNPPASSPYPADSLFGTLQSFYQRNRKESNPVDGSAGNDTPQQLALRWVTQQDDQSYDQSTQITRYALAAFYYSTNNVPNHFAEYPESWAIADNWLTSVNHCSWYGIICDTQGLVESIVMPSNDLTGSLPIELGLFEDSLYHIDITDNYVFMFDSDYDVFLNLKNLETFYASDNYLESLDGLPIQMAALANLEMLEVSYNILGGDLSSNSVLASMPLLSLLEMESNHFTGTIPYYIGNMEDLVYVYLRDNKFTGDLSFIDAGRMTSLFALWLEKNQITGEIPWSIGTLTDLRSLALSENQLSGGLDALGSLPELQQLWIHSNQFFGAIPLSFETMNKLEVLELHNNNLIGKMPQGLCDIFVLVEFADKSLTCDCKGEVECKPECCTNCY